MLLLLEDLEVWVKQSVTLKSVPKLEVDVIILIPVFLYPGEFEFLSNSLESIATSTLFSVRALTSIEICSGSVPIKL